MGCKMQNVNDTHEELAYSLGIAGFLNQVAHWDDWGLFVDNLAPWIRKPFNFSIVSLNHASNMQNDTVHASHEASLDVQYAMALAPHINTFFYSTPGLGPLVPDNDQPTQEYNQNEPYLDQLLYLSSLPDKELPQVISYSYGENEQSVPFDYADQVCTMFGLLSMRGVSILVASGDNGPGESCRSNRDNSTRFNAIFPASCPCVTAVGGTIGVEPERAAYFSSGG